MKIAYDQSGSQVSSIGEYDIAATTTANPDQVVKLSGNKVVPVVAGETAAILGIPAEPHSGSADAFNPRANGKKIKVFDSPSQIYEAPAVRITATGGSITTVAASAVSGFADDDFNGGYLKLVSKVSTSTNTDPIGSVYEITDFTASTGTFTFAAIAGAVTVGDVFEVYPPRGLAKGNFNAAFTNVVYTAVAALPIKATGYDIDRGVVRYEASLHQNANKQS